MVSMKIIEIHSQFVDPIKESKAEIFFSEFFINIYTQKWGSEGQKTWFKNFSSRKTRDLGCREGRECGLELFLSVLSHIDSMQLVRFQTRSLAVKIKLTLK